MTEFTISLPIRRELVTDIIRFSDGKLDPFNLANDQLLNFVERSVETIPEVWGSRLSEVAKKYAPLAWERLSREEGNKTSERVGGNRPLIWKKITIKSGSEVRMTYSGEQFYAKVQDGYIVDDGRQYSPSKWASKIAKGTSRDAWRDLWFREPLNSIWVLAEVLRDDTEK